MTLSSKMPPVFPEERRGVPVPDAAAEIPERGAPPGYQVAPEAALQAIAGHHGPVLVDLDETLYLRNSTEDFIDSAQPKVPALVLLRILDVLKPWSLTGGESTRDAWRVRAIMLVFPWIGWRWRRRVAVLAEAHLNRPLAAALVGRAEPPIIVTVGFSEIVRPLVQAMQGDVKIVAAEGYGFADRRRGKLAMANAALGEDTVRRALVITDSPQDNPLLAACALPLHTVWPEARYAAALSSAYLPGEYLTKVKRPGEKYISRGILQEDFAFWVLSTIAFAAAPLPFVGGLVLLLLSFWTIYEIGYVDNDRVAARFEEDPKLTPEFTHSMVATPTLQPWLWACGAGAAGIFCLRWPLQPEPADFAKWLATLLLTHFLFRAYNRVDKDTRVWMYPFLQLARSAAVAVLVPIAPIGAALFGAQVTARWVPYYIYRFGRQSWPKAHTHAMRVVLFIMLASLLWAAAGRDAVLNWTAFGLLAWSLYRARHEVAAIWRAARRLDRRRKPR